MCDYDLIGGGDPIGKIKLGWSQNKEYKPGFKHWKEALENPRRPIIKWHVLQVITTVLLVIILYEEIGLSRIMSRTDITKRTLVITVYSNKHSQFKQHIFFIFRIRNSKSS